ncbi:MAG: energy transducer TonB [Terriglobales bacterium]
MFTEVQPVSGLRNHRPVVCSVAAHLGLLALVVFHPPKIIQLVPQGLAYGNGDHSYRVVYIAPGTEDADAAPPADPKLEFSPAPPAPRPRPHSKALKPADHHLTVPSDAETAAQNARAGSPLGTMIDGPITGHEVHVAYPVVFPDPPVVRAELPPGLKGDVIVEVTIDAQGSVVETRVLAALGHGIDEKVVATLRQWRFQPATLDGTPVASKHDVHFHFPS